MLRQIYPKALVCVAIAPLLVICFSCLVTLAMMLPNEQIYDNVFDRHSSILDRRADNGRVIDADTECIGMSVGYFKRDDEGAFIRGVRAQSAYGCAPFGSAVQDGESIELRQYFRYWHGYTVIARPLLTVLTYNDLRGLLLTLSVGVFALLIKRLGADFGARFAFTAPFIVLNAMGYWVVATKAVTWFLIIGASLLMTRRQSQEPPVIAFFVLGALTAFFDFLTAPALIFTMPALIWLIYRRRSPTDRDADWAAIIAIGAFWLVGYAGLWAAKLIIAALALGEGVWQDAFSSIGHRLRGESVHVDAYWPGLALLKNLSALKTIWGVIAVGLFFVAPIFTAARRFRWRCIWHQGRLPLFIALAPLGFMEVLSNHSQIHAAFTQLNFALIFIIAGLVCFGGSQSLLRHDSN